MSNRPSVSEAIRHLELEGSFTAEDVRAAYRRIAAANHPDRPSTKGETTEARAHRYNMAKLSEEVLTEALGDGEDDGVPLVLREPLAEMAQRVAACFLSTRRDTNFMGVSLDILVAASISTVRDEINKGRAITAEGIARAHADIESLDKLTGNTTHPSRVGTVWGDIRQQAAQCIKSMEDNLADTALKLDALEFIRSIPLPQDTHTGMMQVQYAPGMIYITTGA